MSPHNVEITIEVLAQYQAKVEYALLCLKKAFTINYQYHLALISKTYYIIKTEDKKAVLYGRRVMARRVFSCPGQLNR